VWLADGGGKAMLRKRTLDPGDKVSSERLVIDVL
jgi:hypothetical protein